MANNEFRWLPAFRDLDWEQQNVVNHALDPGGGLLYGPAGSGKTAIALYCAKTLLDQGKKFHVFVYTNVLFRFLQAGAVDLMIPSDYISTFYRWVRQQYVEQLGMSP